jgi:hypothetical protein
VVFDMSTRSSTVLWRLIAVTMRLVLESFKSLVLASSFWDFLWRPAFILQNSSHCDGHKSDHLRRICDSLKAVTMKTVTERFKSPSLACFFCDYLWPCLFLYFTSVLNRLTYISCCRTNNYQKHFCFWWSNITSLINFGNNSMLLMPNNGSF